MTARLRAALVRGIGAKQDLPSAAFDLLGRFVERLPDSSIDDVLASYAMLRRCARFNEQDTGTGLAFRGLKPP